MLYKLSGGGKGGQHQTKQALRRRYCEPVMFYMKRNNYLRKYCFREEANFLFSEDKGNEDSCGIAIESRGRRETRSYII